MRKNLMSYVSGPYYDVGGHTICYTRLSKQKEKRIGLLIGTYVQSHVLFEFLAEIDAADANTTRRNAKRKHIR